MARLFKRPESVLVVVHTRGGDVLLLRRRWPADFWQSVTGSLEWDESDAVVAARRELREETGLEDVHVVDCDIVNRFPIQAEWQHRYGPGVRENTEHVFRVELPGRMPVQLNPEEHGEYVWLPRDEAAARVTSYTNREAIQRLVPRCRVPDD